MTQAEDMIREMTANPEKYITHPTDQQGKQRKDRISIKFPTSVELRSWTDPTTGQSALSVVPLEDDIPALTTADLALLLGTTQEKLRVVLRELGHGVGTGNRYRVAALQPDFARIRAALEHG
ncbi:hypothetical protein [Glycomyces sp. NPDC047010]|uniref:hypothetical protein n=1 Tax=Glycomyces sp. NPDC047010 TaxID=3155023 RepID=UPI0033CB1B86